VRLAYYASIPSGHERSFYTKGLADLDTGAPFGGLVYARDDPTIVLANATWEETDLYFIMNRFADVELYGDVFTKMLVLRAKSWSYAAHKRPVIAGLLLERLAISLIGAKVADVDLVHVPLELRSQRGKAVIHNGDNTPMWIQYYLDTHPEFLNKSNKPPV